MFKSFFWLVVCVLICFYCAIHYGFDVAMVAFFASFTGMLAGYSIYEFSVEKDAEENA